MSFDSRFSCRTLLLRTLMSAGCYLCLFGSHRAHAADCWRDVDCPVESLCSGGECVPIAQVDDALWCDGEPGDEEATRGCPIDGDWQCRVDTCASKAVVCRNPVGRCQFAPEAWYCVCWDGDDDVDNEFVSGSCDELDTTALADLGSKCEGKLEEFCGTERPELHSSCVGELRESCEHFAELLKKSIRVCGDTVEADPSWSIYDVHQCCEFRSNPENAMGFKCLDEASFETCDEFFDIAEQCTALFPDGVYPGDVEDDDDDDESTNSESSDMTDSNSEENSDSSDAENSTSASNDSTASMTDGASSDDEKHNESGGPTCSVASASGSQSMTWLSCFGLGLVFFMRTRRS